MGDHWFVPKTHAYGATPANWKGWVATAISVIILLALTLVLLLRPLSQGTFSLGQLIVWLLSMGVVVLGFVLLARAKTDGEWRWRWGGEK